MYLQNNLSNTGIRKRKETSVNASLQTLVSYGFKILKNNICKWYIFKNDNFYILNLDVAIGERQ